MLVESKKRMDLEKRTLLFAKKTIIFCKKISRHQLNISLLDQLVRSSSSVGANFREAGERLSKKDFVHRMRITRKECKESTYWLELLNDLEECDHDEAKRLINESKELRNIFSSIIDKAT